MEDTSKIRMNLAAIKKVDPYAKDIVDTSAHVAFYTFNSEENEWEKTDVEGAFFIYSRNAQPYHSVFIINRLNTNSFVEPITSQLELQSQPPFLLYRNERSRIRGFWFYNSQECERIASLISSLVQKTGNHTPSTPFEKSIEMPLPKEANINIFKMLSKAQQEYNDSQTAGSNVVQAEQQQAATAPCNVMQFFAAAKPTSAAEVPFSQQRMVLPNTLSVEQIEKQQLTNTPQDEAIVSIQAAPSISTPLQRHNSTMTESRVLESSMTDGRVLDSLSTPTSAKVGGGNSAGSSRSSSKKDLGSHQLSKLLSASSPLRPSKVATTPLVEAAEEPSLQQLYISAPSPPSTSSMKTHLIRVEPIKPALMPPTMFDKAPTVVDPLSASDSIFPRPDPMSQARLVQAFSYLIQNDEDFVNKLHDAYMKTFSKTLMGSYQ